MAKQKSKPHLQNKNSLFVEAERADSAPAPAAEATDAVESPKAARRGKSDRPKGRPRR
ncbi:hypothetical protein [Embleya scabrispora]|uniref:hypothetical protein n=1 Tax=Embleya scabrispora TaxID=159449 RepID=UPI00039C4F76|nr:hypothetical protein [Embleya scabrispora]MYS82913.1 hypothetical protein [Streptomyces sp. SID5474]